MNQPIFEKITKLLRLAERATGAEAELALSHAHKLATEHQVDLATIDTTEGETIRKEDFDSTTFYETNHKLIWFILWLLQNHFRVRAVVWQGEGRVELVGRKSDVVFGQYLFGWLRDRFLSEWRRELKKDPTPGRRRSANAFFYGMYRGLSEKLNAAKKEAEESRINEVAHQRIKPILAGDQVAAVDAVHLSCAFETDIRDKYQLALVKDEDELEKEYRRLHPRLGNVSMRVNYSNVSVAAGRAAGARTRLPGLPLNNSTRSALA